MNTEFTLPPSTLPRDQRLFELRLRGRLALRVGCTPIQKNVGHAVRTGRAYVTAAFWTLKIYIGMYIFNFTAWGPLIQSRYYLTMLGHDQVVIFSLPETLAKKFRTLILPLGRQNEFANARALASEQVRVEV